MIVDNLYFIRITIQPPEYNSPLIVDANTMKALVLTLQCLQPIARDEREIPQVVRGVNDQQLAVNDAPERLREPSRGFGSEPVKNVFRGRVHE